MARKRIVKNMTLQEQANEILRRATEKGVSGNFFFVTTFKRYQVQMQILTQLEDLPGVRRRVGYVHARHGRRHTDESKTLHRRKDSGFASSMQDYPPRRRIAL